MPSTPTLDQFLSGISQLVRARDDKQIREYLVIEPPYSDIYSTLIVELRAAYPSSSNSGGTTSDDAIETKVSSLLPEAREGVDGSPTWSAFIKFMKSYLTFLRDVDIGNLLDTYGLLSETLGKASSALSHPSLGALMLPTVVAYSRMLARLAIGLDKQPHLIAHLINKSDGDDSGAAETLPERAANTIRQAFVTCLNDRTTGNATDAQGHPAGKKRGVYTLANLCLKILFACHKIRNASQIFENIYNNQGPPLGMYSKAERVTYLYFLGRFLWANGHAYRALKALEMSWTECHSDFVKQKRVILIYLIASNMICGRFPSQALLNRPEARGLQQRFIPVCMAIQRGNLAEFTRLLSPGSSEYEWFAFWRIDVQMRNRCEVFVWRSLVRRAFLISGDPGAPEAKKAPTLDLNHLVTLWQAQAQAQATASSSHIDPDFEGLDPGPISVADPEVFMADIISKMSSLICQDLLNGYLSLKMQKFAIQGARQRGGAVASGFPNVWRTITARSSDEVPGWKKQANSTGSGIGAGMVLNMTGIKPIAAAD